jgi:hypothetical protein
LEASKSDQSTTVSKDNKSSMASNESPEPADNNAKKNPLLNYVELDTLGCGSFGKVVKVQKKSNGNQYAMKVIEKKKMEHVSFAILKIPFLSPYLS